MSGSNRVARGSIPRGPAMSRIIIVDENDNAVGVKERGELIPGDLYRVSSLWLTNSQGEILLAKRALTKKKDPGKWGPAVAGTVDEGETYDDNIVKETFEELGVRVSMRDLRCGPKIKIEPKTDNSYFGQWHFYTIDKTASAFLIPPEEISEVRWFTETELRNQLENHPEKYLGRSHVIWLQHLLGQ